MGYNLDNYEPVEVRLDAFWKQYPNGRVHTAVMEKKEESILILASIYAERNDLNPIATGIAEEIKGSSPVNRISWVENCETSAIGRALANANFAAKGKRPSREEMEKVQRQEVAQQNISAELIELAQNAYEQIAETKDIHELKIIYAGAQEAQLLNVPVNGTTVLRAVNAKKKELEKQIEK
jgi:hypothetical protein